MCHIIYIPVANLHQVNRTQEFMDEILAKKVKSRQDKDFSLKCCTKMTLNNCLTIARQMSDDFVTIKAQNSAIYCHTM